MPLPTLVPVDLSACLEDALDADTPPAGIDVHRAWPSSLPSVLADYGQLKIVLGNLVRNACEAMPLGGRLILDGWVEGEDVVVIIADTGVGIRADEIGRIMEPLFTTKARGLGLGLALSRAILDKHNAVLSVVSEPNQGTTFTVRIKAVLSCE
jgi:signal transduction histidine kinase